ncbi:MAG: Fe-S cluster assembly protein NifU [Hyphomicrobium sp.]|nr:Fe-S cluster assembly protein NifU [Hyphomicrobiaceae bacterium]
MWDYTEKVKEYFFNPKNAGVLESANAIGEVGAIACGDALKLMLKVNPDNELIEDAKFQTFGCGSAIASSSALTELVIGKTLDQALKLTNADIAEFLGGLPPEKMHCSVMGYEALQAAVANFRGEEWKDDHEEGALICKCFGVDEGMLETAIRVNKLTTLEMVTFYTKAGGSCSTCSEAIEEVLAKTNAKMVEEGLLTAEQAFVAGTAESSDVKRKPQAGKAKVATIEVSDDFVPLEIFNDEYKAAAAPKLTTVQKVKLVEETLDEVRPFLKKDGGDCELIDVDGDKVMVKLSGACVNCQLASVTVSGIQEKLMKKTGLPLKVVPVKAAVAAH